MGLWITVRHPLFQLNNLSRQSSHNAGKLIKNKNIYHIVLLLLSLLCPPFLFLHKKFNESIQPPWVNLNYEIFG